MSKRAEYYKKWAAQHPEETRNRHYLKRYGVGIPELEQLLIDQDHKCPICAKELKFRGVKGRDCAIVDHCHITKKVRGLLCTPCNLMLGYSKDTPNTLRSAADYLEIYH